MCSSLNSDSADLTRTAFAQYRRCKALHIRSHTCYANSDCVGLVGADRTCDILQQRCLVPRQEAEAYFVRCLVDSMDNVQLQYARGSLQLPSTSARDAIIQAAQRELNQSDCVQTNTLAPAVDLLHLSLSSHFFKSLLSCRLSSPRVRRPNLRVQRKLVHYSLSREILGAGASIRAAMPESPSSVQLGPNLVHRRAIRRVPGKMCF